MDLVEVLDLHPDLALVLDKSPVPVVALCQYRRSYPADKAEEEDLVSVDRLALVLDLVGADPDLEVLVLADAVQALEADLVLVEEGRPVLAV